MNPQVLDKIPLKSSEEQRISLSGVRWQQYELLRGVLYDTPGIRTAYLDGEVEIMTLSERHEYIKSQISRLLEVYLYEINVDFHRQGSFTMGGENAGASGEPDESYSLGERKAIPDLVIEVIITSGTFNRREMFRRLGVAEVWFWKNSRLLIYDLNTDSDEPIAASNLLPNLNINLFLTYVNSSDQNAAARNFRQAIRQQQNQQ
jgi:Uma2 family endonuclease